jgi:hypothetical protein
MNWTVKIWVEVLQNSVKSYRKRAKDSKKMAKFCSQLVEFFA